MTSTEPRKTRQRVVIADYLADVSHFQTAQQVYDALRARGTPVSLPTVYRALTAMAESGDLDVITENGQSSYRRCSPEHHHHLVCRVCGRTIELPETPVEQWVASIAALHDFHDIRHVTEVSGICPSCQESSRSDPTDLT